MWVLSRKGNFTKENVLPNIGIPERNGKVKKVIGKNGLEYEAYMSETYSTDDLISVVGNYTTGRVSVITYEECEAIIARLRAVDVLYEMAKKARPYLFYAIGSVELNGYDKAIADYGAKKP
jgi:hypothetical protein